MATYLLTLFRATANANHFFSLRREFNLLVKDPASAAMNRTKAMALLKEMEKIATADLENARQALPIARRDPRLDLAVRLDLDYPTLVEMIEAKISFQETELPRQFAVALKNLDSLQTGAAILDMIAEKMAK